MNTVAAARAQSTTIYIEGYCDDPRCPTREVDIKVKDYDGDLLAMLRKRHGPKCPICGGVLKVHGAVTADDRATADKYDGRCSVAIQMYLRDTGDWGVPAGVLLDNRLPPTPHGWWDDIVPERFRRAIR